MECWAETLLNREMRRGMLYTEAAAQMREHAATCEHPSCQTWR